MLVSDVSQMKLLPTDANYGKMSPSVVNGRSISKTNIPLGNKGWEGSVVFDTTKRVRENKATWWKKSLRDI